MKILVFIISLLIITLANAQLKDCPDEVLLCFKTKPTTWQFKGDWQGIVGKCWVWWPPHCSLDRCKLSAEESAKINCTKLSNGHATWYQMPGASRQGIVQ